jgi:hypothetical protein
MKKFLNSVHTGSTRAPMVSWLRMPTSLLPARSANLLAAGRLSLGKSLSSQVAARGMSRCTLDLSAGRGADRQKL